MNFAPKFAGEKSNFSKALSFGRAPNSQYPNDNHFFRKLAGKKAAAGQMPALRGKMIHQFDAGNYAVVEKEVRRGIAAKEIYRLAKLVRESETKKT